MEKDIVFNYALLRGKIKDDFGTFENFAKAMQIPRTRTCHLLTNQAKWTDTTIWRAAQLLGIEEEIPLYFFTPKV